MVREIEMYFDVWASDDIAGPCIGTITEWEAAQIRRVDNSMGSGEFTINRNSTEFADLCATGNLIRVRLDSGGPYDFDSELYVHAFFIEEGEDTIISADEEGGQTVKLAGRGIEAYLERAIIDYVAHHAFNLSPINLAHTVPVDGQWHINDSDFVTPSIGTPGSVLRIFLRDADSQSPQPIPLTSSYPTGHDFNVDHDSLGVSWDASATDWGFDVGTDLLGVLNILVAGGLYYHMFPSLLLQAYEEQQGTDLSGSVSFEEGVNVTTSGTRQIHASTAKSRVLVRGANLDGAYTYHWSEDTDVEAFIGVRQGYTEYGASPTAARLERAGQKLIAALKNQHDGPPIIGVLNENSATALLDYVPGDTVALAIPGYSGNYRIHAITYVMDETGTSDPILEFNEDAVANFASPIAEAKTTCCCSDTDHTGQFVVGAAGGTGTGGTNGVTFYDPADGVTPMAYAPGTALVLVGTSPAATWVPTESDPANGVATVTGATGTLRIMARVSCTPIPPTC